MARRGMEPDDFFEHRVMLEQDLDCTRPAWQDDIEEHAWRSRGQMRFDNVAYLQAERDRCRANAEEAARAAGGFLRAALHERTERRMGGEFEDEKHAESEDEALEATA